MERFLVENYRDEFGSGISHLSKWSCLYVLSMVGSLNTQPWGEPTVRQVMWRKSDQKLSIIKKPGSLKIEKNEN